jgi:hypothetical protein
VSERRQVINLEAFGFPAPDPIVGPFNVFDARIGVSQRIVDLAALNTARAASLDEKVQAVGIRSARELVVLVTVNLYPEAVSASSRIDVARAQLNRRKRCCEKGTVLARIDPREYQVAVDRAAAELADAQAAGVGVPITSVSTSSDLRTASGGVDEAQAGITVATSQVDAAKAQLLAAEARARERQATASRASRDVERLEPLVEKEEIA